jgi:hypothetical protein
MGLLPRPRWCEFEMDATYWEVEMGAVLERRELWVVLCTDSIYDCRPTEW